MSGTVRVVFKWFADSFIWNGEVWNGRSTAMQREVFCDHYRNINSGVGISHHIAKFGLLSVQP